LQRFLKEWEGKGGWTSLIVVEDAPHISPQITTDLSHYESNTGVKTYHVSWDSIDRLLGERSWIISRQDSAIRCFGFLLAYRMGADYVLTLDDDCYPDIAHPDIVNLHLNNIRRFPKWSSTVPGLKVRGLPYKNLGVRHDVQISMGLWTGVPDLDGKTQLGMDENDLRLKFFLPHIGVRLLAQGEYAPLCGMNLCFTRRAIPLLYYPLMGRNQPYKRFDDIWAGVVAERLCDLMGWKISIGTPFVRHSRASDPRANVVKEAPGIEANEEFWTIVDRFYDPIKSPLLLVRDLGIHFQEYYDVLVADVLDKEYIKKLGKAYTIWTELFSEVIL
jgi:hypothetical protein